MNAIPFRAPWLVTLAQVFANAGAPLYAVGGAVRNALMELPASDFDVCGPARPEQVAAFCEGTAIRAVLRAAHFGTVELHVADADGRHMAEYTTFRVDSYRGGHQPVAVRFAATLEVDALRRDFSVNALYRPMLNDLDAPAAVLDPTGGLAHMRQGVLHTVTPDPDQVLKDDGLRILRAARFQAELGFTPTPALLRSAAKFAPLLNDIAHERLRDELTKLLLADTKYPMLPRTVPPVPAGLVTIRHIGAWSCLFGSLAPDEAAIAATAFYRAPDGLSPVSGKLALLFIHESPAALGERMRLLRYSVRETEEAVAALTAARGIGSDTLTLMDAVRLGLRPAAHAVAAFEALKMAGEPCETALEKAHSLRLTLQDARMPKSLKELAVHGDDLLPLCRQLYVPIKVIGAVLDALWQAVVEQRAVNERQPLLTEAKALLSQTLQR